MPFRHLVVGEQSCAVALQIGRLHARRGDHEGVHALAQHRAGLRHHGGLDHARVAHQRVLDLDRIDLVAAAVDHVLLAVEHAHVALRVLRADVARAPVAADDVLCRLRPGSSQYPFTTIGPPSHSSPPGPPAPRSPASSITRMSAQGSAQPTLSGRDAVCDGGIKVTGDVVSVAP
jgi:hypothetical protein